MKTLLGAALMCAAVVLAGPRAASGQEAAGEGPRARQIDAFGPVRGCDHGARLDNFAIELTNNPGVVGYVIAYGPSGERSGTAEYRLNVTKDYLVNMRGIVAERVMTVNGGRFKARDESFVELWVVPPGAEPPRPAEYQNDADRFTGQFSELVSWDSFAWGEATGPPVGDSNLAGFANVLKSQPAARAYVVVYHGEESAPGAWRRVAERETEALKSHGVGADRVRVIFGGYGKELKVQLWALPPEAPPPAADAGPERRVAEAVEVGRINDFQLKYRDEQRSFFRGFAEVLKADETLTAHLIVRLPKPPEDDGAEPAPADPEEPPEIDMARLVEDWKGQLKEAYGLDAGRVVVRLVPPPEEWSEAGIEAWVVPPGAAPPDPDATAEPGAEEMSEEEEAENPEEF